MKQLILLLGLVMLIACKQTSQAKQDNEVATEVTSKKETPAYPESLQKVFEAHGGLDAWQNKQTLVFGMDKPNGIEKTILDLKNRKTIIETEVHKIGYDGERVWLQDSAKTYKGNAKFYYNLMYYFYAMPFILADEGINYETAEPLNFEGKNYLGIKVSYNAGVGESPEDEYILYYDVDTHQMAWLGYTVTYFSKEKSKEYHFIKYSNWQTIQELVLPETLTWYNYENNLPTTKRNDLKFVDVTLSTEKHTADFFEKPEAASFVE